MKNVRRLILYLASAVGIWLLVSFGGAMFDSANAGFWSTSLMWSLLSALVLAPALLMLNDLFGRSEAAERTSSTSRREEQKPFVDENSSEVRTLWPEPERQEDEWPPQEAYEEQERVRA